VTAPTTELKRVAPPRLLVEEEAVDLVTSRRGRLSTSVPGASESANRTSLPTPELERLFLRLREEASRLRHDVLRAAGPQFALSPEGQARANLKIARSIFGKWSIDILTVLLTARSARFSDLRRLLRGISADALSRKLAALESEGLIERRVWTGRPPSVTYTLTEDGLTAVRLGEPVFLFLRLRRPSDDSE
jgi:DNA-binding HxlR family transcriptional regulator